MGDGKRPLEYERAETGQRPLVPLAAVAVGVSAAFVGMSLWVLMPDLHNRLEPVIFWPWVVLGVISLVGVWAVRRQVRRGRWQEARAGRWAMVLLMIGWVLGSFGVAGKVFLPDPHAETNLWGECASNMRQIGAAILLYSHENGGRYPKRLEELLETQDISADVFVCPTTNDQPATGPTTRAVTDGLTVGGHLSYVYLGARLKNDCDPDTVVLYEPLSNHGGRGMNVLFGDGHVEFMWAAAAREILDRVAAGERPVVWKGPGVRVGPTTRGQ